MLQMNFSEKAFINLIIEKDPVIRSLKIVDIIYQDEPEKLLYILKLYQSCKTEEERVIALLHQTYADTKLTFLDLRYLGFSEECINLLRMTIMRSDEPIDQYINRVAALKNFSLVKIILLKLRLEFDQLANNSEVNEEHLAKTRVSLDKFKALEKRLVEENRS